MGPELSGGPRERFRRLNQDSGFREKRVDATMTRAVSCAVSLPALSPALSARAVCPLARRCHVARLPLTRPCPCSTRLHSAVAHCHYRAGRRRLVPGDSAAQRHEAVGEALAGRACGRHAGRFTPPPPAPPADAAAAAEAAAAPSPPTSCGMPPTPARSRGDQNPKHPAPHPRVAPLILALLDFRTCLRSPSSRSRAANQLTRTPTGKRSSFSVTLVPDAVVPADYKLLPPTVLSIVPTPVPPPPPPHAQAHFR
jgi:hypothetical protein